MAANQEHLLASLKVLIAESCKSGAIESQLDPQGITVKLRYGQGHVGDVQFAKQVAALLAQETM